MSGILTLLENVDRGRIVAVANNQNLIYVRSSNFYSARPFTSVSFGTPPYSYYVSAGSLTNSIGTATLDTSTGIVNFPHYTGYPTNTAPASWTFTISVKDANQQIATNVSVFNVTAYEAMVVFANSFPTMEKSLTITPFVPLGAAYGIPPYNYSINSSYPLPPGLTINSSTGVVSGTPTSAGGTPSGTWPVRFTIKDSANESQTYDISVIVLERVTNNFANSSTIYLMTTRGLPNVAYDILSPFQGASLYGYVPAANNAYYTYSSSINLSPYGITYGGIMTTSAYTFPATMYGKPSTTSAGITSTFTVSDQLGVYATSSVTKTIVIYSNITAANTVTNVKQPYSAKLGNYINLSTITASGGSGTYNYKIISGSLPLGCTLVSSNGHITGTPYFDYNTYTVTIGVEDLKTTLPYSATYTQTQTIICTP
jgi:hypothetical protein